MNLAARAGAIAKHWALGAGLGLAVLVIALCGLGFLTGGLYIYIARHTDAASAAAITGGVLLVLAVVIGYCGSVVLRKLKKPQPGLLSDFGGALGMGARLVGLLVRRDPRKAVVLAALAGVIAEYITSDNKKS
jgi:hypothetical protein